MTNNTLGLDGLAIRTAEVRRSEGFARILGRVYTLDELGRRFREFPTERGDDSFNVGKKQGGLGRLLHSAGMEEFHVQIRKVRSIQYLVDVGTLP